jgi:hypothetical protein
VALSLPLTFLIRTIPDPAFEWEKWQNWYPEFASLQTVGFYGLYLILSISIIIWQRKKIIG